MLKLKIILLCTCLMVISKTEAQIFTSPVPQQYLMQEQTNSWARAEQQRIQNNMYQQQMYQQQQQMQQQMQQRQMQQNNMQQMQLYRRF